MLSKLIILLFIFMITNDYLMMNDNIDLSSEFIKIFKDFNDIFYNDNLITCQNSEKYIFHFFDYLID